MNKIISFLNVSNSLDNNIFIFNLSNILKQEHKVILINLDYDDRNNFVNQKNRKIVKVDNINLFNLYQTNKNLIILNYKFDSFEIDKDKITNLVLKQIKKWNEIIDFILINVNSSLKDLNTVFLELSNQIFNLLDFKIFMQNDIKNLFNTKKDNLILNNFNNKNLNQQVNFFYLKKIFTKNIYFLVDEDLNINNKIDYAVVNPWTNYSIHLKEIIDSIIKK